MNVFMLSSQYEGLPLALLEAMAAGIPVVSTAVGGIPEVLHSELAVHVCEPGLPTRLAERALALLEDSGLAQEASDLGFIRARDNHSVEAMAARLAAIYRAASRSTARARSSRS
jgi:glycosyltransferase involved in cell wall biosynthesis